MDATRGRGVRSQQGEGGNTRRVAIGALASALLSATVTPLCAQSTGMPLASPIVHELRAIVPALSRTTINASNATGVASWMSSIDAVTNVAIDVLLLAPSVDDAIAREVHIRDADGVRRRWSDGPIVVARALMPGRHSVPLRWEGTTLSAGDQGRVAVLMRTTTRASKPGAPSRSIP